MDSPDPSEVVSDPAGARSSPPEARRRVPGWAKAAVAVLVGLGAGLAVPRGPYDVTLAEVAQLGPAATALAATVAFAVGLGTLIQRSRADRRDQWWKRAQWALDLALQNDPSSKRIGLAVLEHLAQSRLAGPEETEMIAAAWVDELADLDTGTQMSDNAQYTLVDQDEEDTAHGNHD